MTKRMIHFGSIKQFRDIIRDVQHMARFQGLDGDNQPIYDKNIRLPKIKVIGSEKIHGTNATCCYSEPDGFWVESHKNIITPESDNAGCAFNAINNKDAWLKIIKDLANEYNIDLNNNIIALSYEWCGGSIQKNTAVQGLDKMSMIFQHFKVAPIEHSDTIQSKWYETKVNGKWICDEDNDIYNIMNFPTYEVLIDFETPKMSQNEMVELVEKTIEPDSPVGNALGIKGNVGEGIVFTFEYKGDVYKYKVKGEKHSKTKVKKLKKVDEALEQAKIDFANYATPAWRLEQMFNLANNIINGGIPDVKNIGQFLRLLNQDIIKEESDIMTEKDLEPKQVFGAIAKISKRWYFEQLDKSIGLKS